MSKKSFQQVCEDNWAEDEASSSYYNTCLGWRKEHDAQWYQEQKAKEIKYYAEHVFNKEPDKDELVARFVAGWDEADKYYKDHNGEM
jgi:hypothetical protein